MTNNQNHKNHILVFANFLKLWLAQKPFGVNFDAPTKYILDNPGKFVRPNLILMIGEELQVNNKDHLLLALAVELHHSYTLVHDDLPSMDNDSVRRGKPTLHLVFGEANALLVGDLLLAKSFEVLSLVNFPSLPFLLKLFSFATGAKGLILGQKLDLEFNDKIHHAKDLERLFELKTARLFQFSLTASYLLASPHTTERKNVENFWRLGTTCGLLFQLIDDYQDLTSDKISDLNIFRSNAELAIKLVKKYEFSFAKIKRELSPLIPQTLDWMEALLINKISKTIK